MHDCVTTIKGSHLRTNEGIRLLKDNNVEYKVATVIMSGIELGEKNTDLYSLNRKRDIVRVTGRASLNLLDKKLIKKKLITKESFTTPLDINLIDRCLSGHNCFSRRLYIAANLTVYPCVMERRLSHGTLHNAKLRELINQDILALKKDKIEKCKECEFKYCCHDCRPDSLTDNPYAKPWKCTYDPQSGVWMDPNNYIEGLLLSYETLV